MAPDTIGLLTLLAYLLIAGLLVFRSIRRCEDGWGVWVLYFIQRLYSGLWFHWRANNGPSHLPAEGAVLVIANHRSPIDPMMIWTNHHLRSGGRHNIRVLECLTASEYCNGPYGLSWLTTQMRCIPVDRNGQDMGPVREAIRRLKQGRMVGIFPEGGLNFGHDLREASPGVAFLALKAQAPVIPVFIHGASQEGTSLAGPFLIRQRVRVTYGEPIDLRRWHGVRPTPEVLAEVTDLLMSRLGSLGGVGYTPTTIRSE